MLGFINISVERVRYESSTVSNRETYSGYIMATTEEVLGKVCTCAHFCSALSKCAAHGACHVIDEKLAK